MNSTRKVRRVGKQNIYREGRIAKLTIFLQQVVAFIKGHNKTVLLRSITF